jgi:hypothetical protein
MKKLWILLFVPFLFYGCGQPHSGPVGVVISPPLLWTAVGDDGIVGTAASYEFRMSIDSVALNNSFTTATLIPNPPTPKIAGSAETWGPTVTVELGTTYFFGVVVIDDAGNRSVVSNIARRTFPDNVAPSPVNDLR